MVGFESSPVVSVIERVPRKSEYLIRFSDGSEIKVLEEHLSRFRLEEGACVDQATIEEIDFTYAYGKSRQAALRLLKVRPRTEDELRQRFRTKGVAADVSDRLIADLKAQGLVDDRVFARLWVEEKISRGTHGKKLIRRELQKKGIDVEILEEELSRAYSDAKEIDAAKHLALKRVSRLNGITMKAAKQRVYNHLLMRGFPAHAAREAAEYAVESVTGDREA
jgi:regulatory protein